MYIRLLILSIILYIKEIYSEKDNLLYKCSFDDEMQKPSLLETRIPLDYNNSLYRRRLKDIDEDGFKKFNIFVDCTNLKEEIKKNNLSQYENIIIESLQKTARTLESLLKVQPLSNDFWIDDDLLISKNINYWDKEKFGNEAYNKKNTFISLGIDLVIFPRLDNFTNKTTLASAICFRHTLNKRPLLGILNINSRIEYNKKNIQEYLHTLFLHEFTHILGFSNFYFEDVFHNFFQRKDNYGIERFYLNSSKVIEVAKKYYNCTDIDGIELENYGGSDTVGSHWEARILLGEYMCGYKYLEEETISELTLAYLEDTGFYKANYYTGGLMRFGKNKGCKFIKDKCIIDFEVNPEFENEFYNSIYYSYVDPGCSSGRLSRTYKFLSRYSNIPKEFQYFNNSNYGGFSAGDYCPIPQVFSKDQETNFYSSSCTKYGDGNYGDQIDYPEFWIEGNIIHFSKSYNNSQLEKMTGEKYSDHSFCFLSSLIKKTEEKSEIFSKKFRAICFETFCSSSSLTVKIHENYIVCPRSGGKIEVDKYGGYLLCPDYNLICTGTIMCNNINDCI